MMTTRFGQTNSTSTLSFRHRTRHPLSLRALAPAILFEVSGAKALPSFFEGPHQTTGQATSHFHHRPGTGDQSIASSYPIFPKPPGYLVSSPSPWLLWVVIGQPDSHCPSWSNTAEFPFDIGKCRFSVCSPWSCQASGFHSIVCQ